MKQQFKIDLQHAKKKAVEDAEAMISKKLNACRIAYEEEFEFLARQFEELKSEVDEQRQKWSDVQELVASQEAQIAQMNDMIETVGREESIAMDERRMDDPIEGNEQEDLMNFVADMNDNPDSVQTETVEIVKQADAMLASPFSFYNFGIQLNIEDQIDVANRAYIRFYKKKINDILIANEAVQVVLESNQRLMNTLKQASDRSARKIKELEIESAIVREERITLKLEAERRVQKISKEYIELYKQLARQFEKYKEFIIFELESHEMIREGLEKVIRQKEDYIDDLKEALSVPR